MVCDAGDGSMIHHRQDSRPAGVAAVATVKPLLRNKLAP
jgi:hypothetical protein